MYLEIHPDDHPVELQLAARRAAGIVALASGEAPDRETNAVAGDVGEGVEGAVARVAVGLVDLLVEEPQGRLKLALTELLESVLAELKRDA